MFRTQQRIVRLGAAFIMVGAMLPNVTFLGHWPADQTHSHVTGQADAQSHADHCHDGPSSCGPHALVGTWWVGDGETISLDSAPRLVAGSEDETAAEVFPSRVLRPPQHA
jgi:hypothetical protein